MKELTFKELVDNYAMRRSGKVKGVVVLIKIFDLEADGPWEEEGRGLSRRHMDRAYVYPRLTDFLQERCNSRDMMSSKFDLPNNKYMIAVFTKRDCKKYQALVDYGFEPAIDIEERRNDILKAMAS
jgi:hypothetical protein